MNTSLFSLFSLFSFSPAADTPSAAGLFYGISAPFNIQLVLRSQETKVDEEAKKAAEHPEQEKLNFWGRVGRMLHDFGAIFTGD